MDSSLESTQRLLVFTSSGLEWALPLDAVQEIAPMAQLSTPPGLPPILAGFLNLGGVAVPILRLDKLFNLPEQPPGLHTHLIVLEGADSPTGIMVGSVRRIAQAMRSSFVPLPEGHVFHDCAYAAVEIDGKVVHILLPERILLENERQILAELQVMAQQRLSYLTEGA